MAYLEPKGEGDHSMPLKRRPVSLFGVTLPAAAGKQLRSITLPKDPRLHLYAVTLA
jgi:hypothetical protein